MPRCGTCEHRLRTWPANFHFCLECPFKCRTVRWLQSSGYRGPPSLERQAFFSTIPGSLLLPPKRLSPRCRGSLKIHEPFLDDRPINAFLRRSRWYPNSSIWSYNSFEVLARSSANSINQIACNITYFCCLVNSTIDRWLLSWSMRLIHLNINTIFIEYRERWVYLTWMKLWATFENRLLELVLLLSRIFFFLFIY